MRVKEVWECSKPEKKKKNGDKKAEKIPKQSLG